MSINDPQWGNSHRPEKKEPEQVPEVTGTEPLQPQEGGRDPQPEKAPDQTADQRTSSSPPKSPPPQMPPEGPPDLEELWQRLVYQTRCKLARAFGKAPPPSPQVPAEPPSPPEVAATDPVAGWQALSFKSWLIGVSLIIGAWLVSGFYLVDVQQRAVLSRFGSIISVEAPGWHWRWPYPVDSIRLINVTADRTLEVSVTPEKGRRASQGLMMTADGALVGLTYAVVYQVEDPVAYLTEADTPSDLLALMAESSLRALVSQQTLSTLLTMSNPQTAASGKPILQGARDQLDNALAPFKLGIVVKGLEIRDVQLPSAVVQSAKEAQRQEQASAKALREAQTASTERLIKARQLAAKLQEESQAYARTLDGLAQTWDVASAGIDKAGAQKVLTERAASWRTQYPLVYASPSDLEQRLQGGKLAKSAKDAEGRPTRAGAESTANVNQTGAAAPTASDLWRDREIMRSRDRVERPGSGL